MTGFNSPVLIYDRSRTAFMSSDDWTNVRDPVLRRKIQNRVAQRNYRRKIKAKLQELERRRSGGPDGNAKAMSVSAIEPTSESRPASTTPTSSPLARPQSGSVQNHSPASWQQRSGATSNAVPPASYSQTVVPSSGCYGTAQSGDRTLCAQCSLPLPWPGMAESSGSGCSVWESLAGRASGPFDEGYAAIHQAQWPGIGSARGARGSL